LRFQIKHYTLIDHALGQLRQIKDGEVKGIPAEDLLNEL
jgi:hypothetical protein